MATNCGFRFLLSTATLILLPISAVAFSDGSIGIGVGWYSENILSKTSQDPTGSSSFLGESNYPIDLKYDFEVYNGWFLAPELYVTPVARTTPGGFDKVSLMHFVLPLGKNFSGSSSWDWFVGPGLIRHSISGSGGTTTMPNGTGTITYSIPQNTVTVQKLSANFGTSYTWQESRFGFDLIVESLMSNTRRTESFMLSYAYQFGGGSGGGGGGSGHSPKSTPAPAPKAGGKKMVSYEFPGADQ